MAERQTNYTIGEGVELPSRGLIYDGKQTGAVELRSMTGRDEMKRLAPSTTQFKNLADIIEGCMIERPGVHVYDMALGDYEFLLHKLRIVTYGELYKMNLRCNHCAALFEASAHLEELEVKEFDYEKFDALRTLVLPRSGNTVSLRYQTPRMLDEQEAKVKEMRRKYKDADFDFSQMVLLLSVIESVNGQHLDSFKLEAFINNLPAADMMKIINTVDELNAMIGLDTSLRLVCPDCGGQVVANFRFGPEFFRPTTL